MCAHEKNEEREEIYKFRGIWWWLHEYQHASVCGCEWRCVHVCCFFYINLLFVWCNEVEKRAGWSKARNFEFIKKNSPLKLYSKEWRTHTKAQILAGKIKRKNMQKENKNNTEYFWTSGLSGQCAVTRNKNKVFQHTEKKMREKRKENLLTNILERERERGHTNNRT